MINGPWIDARYSFLEMSVLFGDGGRKASSRSVILYLVKAGACRQLET